ncbi:MAG: glycosyl transferase family 28 [Phycisphaerales bacterium]|nr:glycosyl transferase family 28 [Phycisphaerales bacterium]
MIFVTVGAQMPFDRLVQAVDAWAGQRPDIEVFAQIGPTSWRPQHARWTQFLDPPAFEAACRRAEVLVAHAGMGSIITALELGKPILVMPRRGALGETRNDHQVATARRFAELGAVEVAWDEAELGSRLEAIVARLSGTAGADSRPAIPSACERAGHGPCVDRQPGQGCPRLVAALRAFIVASPSPAPQALMPCRAVAHDGATAVSPGH